MNHRESPRLVRSPGVLSRRELIRAGSAAAIGLALPGLGNGAVAVDNGMSCIMLNLVGGPSQLDTWDPKPEAPNAIRGPFRPIATSVPGTWISELFPKLARTMDKVALVRSVHHDGPAVHDVGHQWLQTGRFFGRATARSPHIGSILSYLQGSRWGMPAHVMLPGPIGNTGGLLPHGQDAGILGDAFNPIVPRVDGSKASAMNDALAVEAEPDRLRKRYGPTPFGRDCLRARRLVERGTRFVTVNMFDTVFNRATWDTHGSSPFSTLNCLRNEVAPAFDAAYSRLIVDLHERGMLDSTLVVACGEFGRSPRINPVGGRDHHPGCWTVLFAGGAVRGGAVVGASDAIGHAPMDRPVTPPEVAATVLDMLGIKPDLELPGPDGLPWRPFERGVEPIRELYRT